MSEPIYIELAVRQCESGTASATAQKAVAARFRERTSKLAKATERIVALGNEIARLREERRWIPVGERLPDGDEWVDTAGPWGECVGWHDEKGWHDLDEDEPCPSEVTHWRKRGPGPEAKDA